MSVLHGGRSRYFKLVKSEGWRRRFLEQLAELDGFEELLANSREVPGVDLSRFVGPLKARAKRIIKIYSKYELAAARQYYNNEQLIHFWRAFSREIEKLVNFGAIPREYPVFEIDVDWKKLVYRIKASPMQRFQDLDVYKVSDQPLRYRWVPKTNDGRGGQAADSVETTPVDLESLLGKLTLLHRMVSENVRLFYNVFVERHKRMRTLVWEYYKIHQFLDNFFYVAPNGEPCWSSFDYVFFNTNLHELRLFLQHHFARRLPLTLSEVDEFLKRQRTYYLKRAVSISLEENEAMNQRKDLFRYDENMGVVTLIGFTDEIKRHFHKFIEAVGFLKFDGCPFAKSKGAERNALIEVYEFFDRLMLHLLAHSGEFDCLFDKQKRETA